MGIGLPVWKGLIWWGRGTMVWEIGKEGPGRSLEIGGGTGMGSQSMSGHWL